ncbi:MAG: transposase [Myxococcales bacterium]|nr:transposase [Myxococcales bacterium]
MSLPGKLRFPAVREAKLLLQIEKELVRAIFRWRRKRARQLGVEGKLQCGAVRFVQLFSAQLGLHPHLHVLEAEGVFSGADFIPLPPPSPEEVEAVLARMLRRLAPLFQSHEEYWPEDGFEALQYEGAQRRLMILEDKQPERAGRRVATGEGFSLHAGTHVHAADREGLARLVRYGARGPVAESQLSRREDGKYAYQTKKGGVLVLSAETLVKRLLWLIPPARLHLTNFHGLCGAPHKPWIRSR